VQEFKFINLTHIFYFLLRSTKHFLVIRLRLQTSSIRNNALHNLTLIKLTVARFLDRGTFLTRYTNGRTK